MRITALVAVTLLVLYPVAGEVPERHRPLPRPPVPPDGVFLSWAALDRRTGAVTGSADRDFARSSTESMIKVWIAGDHLRRGAVAPGDPARAADLIAMIRDSDDRVAEELYRAGGGDAVVRRMISTCRLTGTVPVAGWWSATQVTAADAVRLGRCVADGRAAGPWTGWILHQMRQVRGEGRFGIVDGIARRDVADTAMKNGWTLHPDGIWHVACLAVHPRWILAVLTRYPQARGLGYGAGMCAAVARGALAGT